MGGSIILLFTHLKYFKVGVYTNYWYTSRTVEEMGIA